MKAARLHEGETSLRLEDVPVPELESSDDVIVRVAGAGLCRTDIHLIDGALDGAIPYERPVTLGHETSGWIEALGAPVPGLAVGSPVLIHPIRTCGRCERCRRDQEMFCENATFTGLWADGGFAEYVKTSVRALIPLSAESDLIAMAPHADAGLTAIRAVRKAVRLLDPGSVVVVIGAGGGLGHIAIQMLKAMSAAQVIGVDSRSQALELARELGVDRAFDSAEAAAGVADATHGRGAEVVLDFVGENGTPALATSLLGQAGTYLVVGYGDTLELPTGEVVVKELRIEGTLVGTHRELGLLVDMVERGLIRLRTEQYPLARINDALDDLRAGRVQGRAVIAPAGEERRG
jgi:NAD+-dependent secondary alcohol dehydrogenase Adh1